MTLEKYLQMYKYPCVPCLLITHPCNFVHKHIKAIVVDRLKKILKLNCLTCLNNNQIDEKTPKNAKIMKVTHSL